MRHRGENQHGIWENQLDWKVSEVVLLCDLVTIWRCMCRQKKMQLMKDIVLGKFVLMVVFRICQEKEPHVRELDLGFLIFIQKVTLSEILDLAVVEKKEILVADFQ